MKPIQKQPPPPGPLRIERVGADGDGVGSLPDGTPLYVPFTLPGELVAAAPVRSRGEGWLARATGVQHASDARVAPPCGYFGRCGGCALQHWRDPDYAAWKRGLLAAALKRAGFTQAEPGPLVVGAPGERRRLDFAVRRERGQVVLGLHAAGSTEVVDLAHCTVLHPALVALTAPLRAALQPMQALRREASVVINLLDAGADVLLRTDAALPLADRNALVDFARAHGVPRVSWALGGATPETVCIFRPAATLLSGTELRPPPGAFLQATATGERAIVEAVLAGLPTRLPPRARIAELYAGCGTLTLALAGALAGRARVSAWEGDAPAAAALRQAVNQAGQAGRIEVAQRDLARQPLSAKELAGFSAVVLDPPHAGAAPQVAQIAAAGVPTVAYVSCNPATLARDARALHAAGYALAAATPIDLFVWSARLESVCVFRRP